MIPYQKWHSLDWLGSRAARVLDYEEQGIFRALLDIAWSAGPGRDESPPVLPDDPSELAWELGLEPEKFAPIWKRIRRLLVAGEEGWVHCRRQMQEYARAKQRIEQLRELGRRGGQASGKRRPGARSASAKRTLSAGSAKAKRKVSVGSAQGKRTVGSRLASAERTLGHPDPEPDSDPEPTASSSPPVSPPPRPRAGPAGNGGEPVRDDDLDDEDIRSVCRARFATVPTRRQLERLKGFLRRFYPVRARAPALRRLAAMMAFKRLGFGFLAESLRDPESLRSFEAKSWAEIWVQTASRHGPGCRPRTLACSVASQIGVPLEALEQMLPPSERKSFQEALE